jgi:hypothetical protein
MIYVDLHLHSFYSDGENSPTEVVQKAKSNGLGRISLTDHDSIDGYVEFSEESKKQGISALPGVEITTIDYHMLGYGFDVDDNNFKDFVKYSQSLQAEVCKARVKILKDYGVPIEFEEIEANYPKSTLGKIAILRTMLSNDKCLDYLKEKHGEMDKLEMFKTYLGRNGIVHHVDTDDHITWKQSSDEIHKAGGIAIASHPPIYSKDPFELEQHFKLVDGLEIQPKFVEDNIPFEKYAINKGMAVTYGSDFHNEKYQNMLKEGERFLDKATLRILGLS